MHSVLLILVMAAFAAVSPPAAALDAAQTAAIDKIAANPQPGKTPAATLASHYAVLLWVEDYCKGQSDDTVRDYLMSKTTADQQNFEAAWQQTTAMLAGTDAAAMCKLALQQYGPEGELIPRGWRPKN